jgi:hypothetical protein
MDPAPSAKPFAGVKGEAGCSHIFGLFKELHFTLWALMEIRASSPGQIEASRLFGSA